MDEDLVVRGPFTPDLGAAAVSDVLDRRTGMTALFAANHESVFGLTSRGVSMPDDL